MPEVAASPTTPEVLGVALIGAGPVAQAIHIPTLARLGQLFRVVSVMDVDPAIAATVASIAGARAVASVDAVLADPEVGVVVICSPNRFHADQVIAACRAGKRAVLCEKPLVTDLRQAEKLAEVARDSGVPIIVGAMHSFDPGWTAALAQWQERTPRFIRSSIVLPPNDRFETLATELFAGASANPAETPTGIEALVTDVRGGVLGLAIHDIPLIRRLLPSSSSVTVRHVAALSPYGYLILLEVDHVVVELHALMSENWEPSWVLEAVAADVELSLDFTPSYVHAGSSTGAIRRPDGSTLALGPFAANGFQLEWETVYRAALDGVPVDVPSLLEDVRFALMIADSAEQFVRANADTSTGAVPPGVSA